MIDDIVDKRSKDLINLGLTFNGKSMSYTKKDFNVHSNEILYSSESEWEDIITGIKMEMERRAEMKPFKNVDRDTCEAYWRIRLHKCGKRDIPTEKRDRDEFIDYLLDIEYFDPILTEVSTEWDMIMREYIDNFYIPELEKPYVMFMSDWKYYR